MKKCKICGRILSEKSVLIDGNCLRCYKKYNIEGYIRYVGNKNDKSLIKKDISQLTKCFRCEHLLLTEGAIVVDGREYCRICNTLLSNHKCKQCGKITHFPQKNYCSVCYTEHKIFCCKCADRVIGKCNITADNKIACEKCAKITISRGLVFKWDFKPQKYIFKRYSFDDAVFMGIELEVDTPGSVEEKIYDTNEIIKDIGYLKHDGSVLNGFEIVTHPISLEYHKNLGWRERLAKLQKLDMNSHKTGNCGLHIHVSKKSLANWWKPILFIYTCKEKMKVVSRRGDTPYLEKYCPILRPEYYGDYKTPPQNNERYVAINTMPPHTAEFRMFRGTLKFSSFWSSLLFVDALIYFCKGNSIAYFRKARFFDEKARYEDEYWMWQDFINYVDSQSRYNMLSKYLKKCV